MVTLVRFGFDRERLYVRLDGGRRLVDLLADGLEFSLTFLQPDGVRLSVRQTDGRIAGALWVRNNAQWIEREPGGAVAAAGTLLEVAVPLVALGLRGGDRVAFFVAVFDGSRTELERHPVDRPIETEVPDDRFAARQWNP